MMQDFPHFSKSILIFLPKKAIGRTVDGHEVFDPGGVQPLNITNTDNRLLASARRLALESA